jgi:hypothetical protein
VTEDVGCVGVGDGDGGEHDNEGGTKVEALVRTMPSNVFTPPYAITLPVMLYLACVQRVKCVCAVCMLCMCRRKYAKGFHIQESAHT